MVYIQNEMDHVGGSILVDTFNDQDDDEDEDEDDEVSTYNEASLCPGQEGDGAAVHQQVVAHRALHQLTEMTRKY